MGKVALTEGELIRRVGKFLRDYRKFQKGASVPFYFVSRKFGKLCSFELGRPLQEVLEGSDLFIWSMNTGGGLGISLKEVMGPSAAELLETDPNLKKLDAVMKSLKSRGIKPDRATMEAEWVILYNEPYPFPPVE